MAWRHSVEQLGPVGFAWGNRCSRSVAFASQSQSSPALTRVSCSPNLKNNNMYTNKSAALSLALFLALVEVGTCLQCYHCTSQSDPKCGTTLTSDIKAKDCMSEDSVKYNQQTLYNILPSEIFGGVKGATRYCHKFVMETGTVVRTCLDGSAVNKEQTCNTMIENSKSMTNDKKVKSCMVCDKDNCNGAGALSMSLPLSALTLIISYILYKQ